MLHQAGLDAEGIESSVRQAWSKLVHGLAVFKFRNIFS
jgi:hypothetical protein